VVVNVLNPKTAIFFVAFFPQFVDPTRGHVALQMAILGLCFVVLGILSDGSYALAASAATRLFRRNTRRRPPLLRLSGGGFTYAWGRSPRCRTRGRLGR
jgi:threonine/homoserine/homoserine lactone efflux protein